MMDAEAQRAACLFLGCNPMLSLHAHNCPALARLLTERDVAARRDEWDACLTALDNRAECNLCPGDDCCHCAMHAEDAIRARGAKP